MVMTARVDTMESKSATRQQKLLERMIG
jgi:hypothetical protein